GLLRVARFVNRYVIVVRVVAYFSGHALKRILETDCGKTCPNYSNLSPEREKMINPKIGYRRTLRTYQFGLG
ncbi:MAG: hypothetical protein ACRDS9_13575, partial [Pseudonocardiaceae bacterium]